MTDLEAVLKGCTLLSGLPEEGLREAMAVARLRQVAAGEVIYEAGSAQSMLCVIAEGSVRLGSVNAAGREAMLVIFGAGSWFGDTVFSPEMPRVYAATAHEAATLVEIPGEELHRLFSRYPQCYPVVLDLVSRRLWATMSIIEDDALRGIDTRIGRRLQFLVEFQVTDCANSEPVTLHITREHIANMMGMTRQGVHKVLKRFEEQGLVQLSYGRITVPDPAALAAHIKNLE